MTTQRRVGAVGGIVTGDDELEQSLCLLVTARQGTIPHRPDLGSLLFELLDQPINIVRAKAPSMVQQAAKADERIVVDGVDVVGVAPGNLEMSVRWHPRSGGVSRATGVTIR